VIEMTNGPTTAQGKKGLPPIAWIAIGCAGVLVVVGIVAVVGGLFVFNKAKDFAEEMEEDPILASAKLLSAANPEIELVEADKDNERVTFRNTETGEEYTVDYDDIREGRISFSSSEGTMTLDVEEDEGRLTVTSQEGTTTYDTGDRATDLPDWVPVYPGSEPEGAFKSQTPDAHAGAYTIRTKADRGQVVDYFAAELERAGLEIRSRTTMPDADMLVATSSDEARTATVTASTEESEVSVMVNFMEKK
jgi:hypothetical protein